MQENERVLGPTAGKPRGVVVWGETGDSPESIHSRHLPDFHSPFLP